jgi:hypothetical protein
LRALGDAGRDWRCVSEAGIDAMKATLTADIAIGPFLRRTIPDYLQAIDEPRLPRLPRFLVNLYLPATQGNEIADELARHVRQEFAARFRRPAVHAQPSLARRRLAAAVHPAGA